MFVCVPHVWRSAHGVRKGHPTPELKLSYESLGVPGRWRPAGRCLPRAAPHLYRALSVALGPTYQQQLHGELDGVAVEGNADALVDSQSHHGREEQQDAGRVRFWESYAVVNYVLKEENDCGGFLRDVTAAEI